MSSIMPKICIKYAITLAEDVLRKRFVFRCDLSPRIFSVKKLVCQRARSTFYPGLKLLIARKYASRRFLSTCRKKTAACVATCDVAQ